MNVLVSTNAQSHHLVQVPLEISLLHVDLLIGLNDIFQLLLPFLTLLKLDNACKVSENSVISLGLHCVTGVQKFSMNMF